MLMQYVVGVVWFRPGRRAARLKSPAVISALAQEKSTASQQITHDKHPQHNQGAAFSFVF